jgi:hypothetical protein
MSEGELQHTTFDSAKEYIAALDTICGLAQYSLNIFEKNFADIGFNSEARYETLRHFLLTDSRAELRLLAHDIQHIAGYCPRLMLLLKQYNHRMHIFRTPPHLRSLTEPFAVADDLHFVRRFHFDYTRGILAKFDPAGAGMLKSQFKEMWQSSHSGVAATTIGL